MLVLIATALNHQHPAIWSLLSIYVGFRAASEAIVPPNDPAVFQLTFHLPYFALRRSETPREDQRKTAAGRPLRNLWVLDFLEGASSLLTVMYEAHISVAVTVSNGNHWAAYVYVESYFDNEATCDTCDKLWDAKHEVRRDKLSGRGILGKARTPPPLPVRRRDPRSSPSLEQECIRQPDFNETETFYDERYIIPIKANTARIALSCCSAEQEV
jgi:hypothetical protein